MSIEPAMVSSGSVGIATLLARRRFDASVYDLETLEWHARIAACSSLTMLSDSIVESATYPGRFKRKYVDRAVGLPFLLPSQIEDLIPRPTKWIAGLSQESIDQLSVHKGNLLLTRSGSIGKIALANSAMADAVTSDDLIRIVPSDGYGEYLFAFLKSRVGQLLLQANEYGAVIQHIEPHHLEGIPVPTPTPQQLNRIRALIVEAEDLKESAATSISEATSILLSSLAAPEIGVLEHEATAATAGVRVAKVPLSQLANRFDASFHDPVAARVELWLSTSGVRVVRIDDADVSRNVILSPRFKRTYVDAEHGVPLIGGKNLGSLDPRNGKFITTAQLSDNVTRNLHAQHLQVLITRSGTIGKIALAPQYWEGWALSEHIIRVIPANAKMAAYLSCWLSTDLGQAVLKRQTYGAVVDEIDAAQVGSVVVPIIGEEGIDRIAELILEADQERARAFALIAAAVNILEVEILDALPALHS